MAITHSLFIVVGGRSIISRSESSLKGPIAAEDSGRAVSHSGERNIILDGIRQQLTYEPNVETRNRKALRENPLADWELRIDPFRIFYEISLSENAVRIVAIGRKDRARLLIGGREFKL